MTIALFARRYSVRRELIRWLDGVSQQLEPINSTSWIIGHLAVQDQQQGIEPAQAALQDPSHPDFVGNGKPASPPPVDEMWTIWSGFKYETDQNFETKTSQMLTTHQEKDEAPGSESAGRLSSL